MDVVQSTGQRYVIAICRATASVASAPRTFSNTTLVPRTPSGRKISRCCESLYAAAASRQMRNASFKETPPPAALTRTRRIIRSDQRSRQARLLFLFYFCIHPKALLQPPADRLRVRFHSQHFSLLWSTPSPSTRQPAFLAQTKLDRDADCNAATRRLASGGLYPVCCFASTRHRARGLLNISSRSTTARVCTELALQNLSRRPDIGCAPGEQGAALSRS